MAVVSVLSDLVDLHLHLGSATTPHTLWELAHAQGIRLPHKDYFKFIDSVTIKENTTYERYLSFFHLTELIQSSTDAISRAVHDAISRAYRKAGVTTVEIRFNPMLRNRSGERDLDKIIFSALVGMKQACLEYPVRAGIILMMDRRFTPEQNEIIVRKAIRFQDEGVVGIDLAGPVENNFLIDTIVEPVRIAKSAGLGITIHSGEATGTEEMWEVITKLHPNRIGHGIRSVEDPTLLSELAKRNIVLEVCPSSNIRTQVVRDYREMGDILNTLTSAGVLFCINSDGPELVGTNVREEYERLFNEKLMTEAQIADCLATARKVSFISRERKP